MLYSNRLCLRDNFVRFRSKVSPGGIPTEEDRQLIFRFNDDRSTMTLGSRYKVVFLLTGIVLPATRTAALTLSPLHHCRQQQQQQQQRQQRYRYQSVSVTEPLVASHTPKWNLPPSYLHSTVCTNSYTSTSLSLSTASTDLETSDTPQNNNNNVNDNESNMSNSNYNNMNNNSNNNKSNMKPWETLVTKVGMMTFILAMCIALPVTLIPQRLLLTTKVVTRIQSEQMALSTGQWCARWLLRIIPFCRITCYPNVDADPKAAIWVCNHTSMLDVFILLAVDRRLRGKTKRPIKIVYWQQLENNPVTKLLFRQAGFIPVQMSANGHGEANDYDRMSFKSLLTSAKQAFVEGFDIAILPEGQLNPHPEQGLLPLFSGAYTLAKLSKRKIHFMALHGVHTLWHPIHGMEPTGRDISVQVFPGGRMFASAAEFVDTFTHVVGPFGTSGKNAPDVKEWLDGSAYLKVNQNESCSTGTDTVIVEE